MNAFNWRYRRGRRSSRTGPGVPCLGRISSGLTEPTVSVGWSLTAEGGIVRVGGRHGVYIIVKERKG